MPGDLAACFGNLRDLLGRHAGRLHCSADSADAYSLETPPAVYRDRPMLFAALRINRRSVTFQLMPVYVDPALLDGRSPALLRALKGKSCLHFTAVDAAMVNELDALLGDGLALYAARGWLEAS